MVKLTTVRTYNATLGNIAPNLVAVFVGGTSGIGLSTALALARHTRSPRIYLVGRSVAAADSAMAAMRAINSSTRPTFLQADVSQLRNVDAVCLTISSREPRVNLLFMTPGYLTLNGSRDETPEGLDRKMALHYYARMRFVDRLAPLLAAAAATDAAPKEGTAGSEGEQEAPQCRLSRVVSVLDPHVIARPGSGSTSTLLDFDDLGLAKPGNFTLRTCGAHASLMNSFFMEDRAARMAQHHHGGGGGTSFVHAYPSGVDTGVARELPLVARLALRALMPLMRPFLMVPLEESGERHLWVATSGLFPPARDSDEGETEEDGRDVAMGSTGERGSGSHWVNWDGEVFRPKAKIEEIRRRGAVEKVVKHTEEVFLRVCGDGKTDPWGSSEVI